MVLSLKLQLLFLFASSVLGQPSLGLAHACCMSKTLKPLHALYPDARRAIPGVGLRQALGQSPRDARAHDELSFPARRQPDAVGRELAQVLRIARQGIVVDFRQAVIDEAGDRKVAREQLETRHDVAQL